MLTLQQIKSNPAEVVARLAVKGFDGKEAIDRVLALDDRRRQLQLDITPLPCIESCHGSCRKNWS